MTACGNTQVQDFYQNCGVFVTGGTGTLGKLTIEKILRSCPGVRKVYMLIRTKKRLSAEERNKVFLENMVFERMKSEQPECVKKIVFMAGDCSEPRLGLSDSDYHDLTQNVNIVMHMAATVKFDEILRTAVDINVKGTLEVINLCRNCVSLKAAVFVSTAFSNCVRDVIKEEFYDPPILLDELLELLKRLSTSELTIIQPKITGGWPNSYVFSKAMSEYVIRTQSKGIPASIVRPSMVLPTLREPCPGWIDNIYGPIAIAVGVGCGILRVSQSHCENVLDVIPADTAANCVIVSALSARKGKASGDVSIFNITTSDTTPRTLGELKHKVHTIAKENPIKLCIWYPVIIFVTNHKLFMVLSFLLHFLPGCLLDLGLRLAKRPPMLLKIYRKIQNHTLLTYYFSKRNYLLLSENTQKLYNSLEVKDQEMFSFNTKLIDWNNYLNNVTIDSRKYILNGMLSAIDEGGTHLRKLYIAHTMLKSVLYGLALWTVWRMLKLFNHTY